MPMYCSTTEVATDDEIGNLTKLLTLWVGEQEQVLHEDLKSPRADLTEDIISAILPHSASIEQL